MDVEQHKDAMLVSQREALLGFASESQLEAGLKLSLAFIAVGRSSEMREATWSCTPSCCISMVLADVQGSPLGYRDLRLNPF